MDAVTGYTKDQLVLFYEKSAKLDARRRNCFINDVRSAVWAEGKELKKILDLLDSIYKGGDRSGNKKERDKG